MPPATVVPRSALTTAADPVADLLRELVWEVRGLRADLTVRREPARHALSRADLALLGRLLPAWAGTHGSDEQLTSRDLAADPAPAMRLVLRGLSVKQIGRLLARADGIPIGGYLVERCGIEINVTLWRVVAVSHG
jgi:hypothetical protein